MDAVVREFGPRDREPVRRLRYRTFSAETYEPDRDERYIADDRRVVAELDGRVVGHAGAWRFGQFFGSQRVPMAGVAAVLVEPHARGTGVASQMVRQLVERARDQGDAIAMLYPATVAPYRRLGWEFAGGRPAHTLPTRSLLTIAPPAATVTLRPGTTDDTTAMRACYRDVVRGRDGWLELDPDYLASRAADDLDDGPDERWIAERDGEVSGYVAYTRVRHAGAASVHDHVLRVDELAARDGETERSLWRLIGGSWTIWPRTRVRGGTSALPLHLLPEAEPRPDTHAWSRWMLRLLDVPAAFAARGYPGAADAEIHLEVTDPWLADVAGRWVLTVEGGRGQAEPGGDGTVRVDVGALSSSYAGYTPPREWHRLGRLTVPESSAGRAALDALDALLRGGAPTCAHYF